MAVTNPYEIYKNQSIMLASPEELTLMLYNGCAKFIRLAQAAITDRDIPHANEYIQKAQAIIEELMATLDMSYNISKGWMELYRYMNSRLIDANIAKDTNILDEVLGLVIEFRDTWAQAMHMAAKKTVAVRG